MADGVQKAVVIGSCRLILGDCLSVDLGPVDHVVSDPPYEEVMHNAKSGARGRKSYGSKRRIRIDGNADPKPLNFSSIDAIRADVVALCERVSGGWVLLFCTPEGVGRWADEINKSRLKYKRACTWVKPDCTPQLNGQGPAMGAENFVCAWAGAGRARWNAGGKRGVYTHNVNPPDRHGGHPTEKPWRLMVELLDDFTCPGETVLDPFMGSGTTGVACVKTGRSFVGVERDPDYFEIACERIRKALAEPDMFIPTPPAATQTILNFTESEVTT